MFRAGAQVLRRVRGIGAKRRGGMPGPASWVVEKSVRERNAIRMSVGNDRFRLPRVDDHADRLHRNAAPLRGRDFDAGVVEAGA